MIVKKILGEKKLCYLAKVITRVLLKGMTKQSGHTEMFLFPWSIQEKQPPSTTKTLQIYLNTLEPLKYSERLIPSANKLCGLQYNY